MATQTYMNKQEKLTYLKTIADEAVRKVGASKNDWREFLQFYAKFYKYSFSEALLIHEQAPDATACGELKHWNMVGRRVHKGTKSIPIINETDRNMNMRYIFDVSDTYGEDRGIPRRWVLPDKYKDSVLHELQSRFTTHSPTEDYSKNLKWAVEEYARDACLEYLEGIQYDVEGSFLEELDMDNIRKEFTDTVIDSVGYLICERLEIEKGLYNNDDLAFEYLHDFNTKATMSRLGVAVNHISRNVLTLVNETIRREAAKERTNENERTNNEIGRSQESVTANAGGNRGNGGESITGRQPADGKIRDTGMGLSERTPSEPVHVSDVGNDLARNVPPSGQRSQRDDGHDTGAVAETDAASERGLHGDSEIRNEHPRPSGGNSLERDSLQSEINNIEETQSENEPEGSFSFENTEPSNSFIEMGGSFFNPENEDLYIREASLLGSGFENGKQRIYDFFKDGDKTGSAYASFLQKEYGTGGRTFDFSDGAHSFIDHNSHGITIKFGFGESDPKLQYSWAKVAGNIFNLVKNGEYYTPPQEQRQLYPGLQLTIDGRQFSVDRIDTEYGDVSLRDITFQNGTGFPIFRKESIDFVLMYLESQTQPEIKPPTERYGQASLFDLDLQNSKEDFDLWEENETTVKKSEAKTQNTGETTTATPLSNDRLNQATDQTPIDFGLEMEKILADEQGNKKPVSDIQRTVTPFIIDTDPTGISEDYPEITDADRHEYQATFTNYNVINEKETEVENLTKDFHSGVDGSAEKLNKAIAELDVLHEKLNANQRVIDLVLTDTSNTINLQKSITTYYKFEYGTDNSIPETDFLYNVYGNTYVLHDFEGAEIRRSTNQYGMNIETTGNAANDINIELNWQDVGNHIRRLIAENNYYQADTEQQGLPQSQSIQPSPQQKNNFHISIEDGVGRGTPKQKYRLNVEAIKLLNVLETENRIATREEQSILATYSGWGGLSQAFDERNDSWRQEYKELKDLLSEKEYESAISSTLNAHFTSTDVIEGIYKGLDRIGFKGGNVLEPSMGVGNFFGMLPEELSERSRLYGVELDPITGRIAKKLYPNADIKVQGFETADLSDNFFDVAVGNVPFGDYKLNDSKYDKYNLLIHDYFFCKSLDKVRPGGVVAFITSKGTMDKQNTSVRRFIAERAELLGAIRLPNDAFKQSAGTEVTSDIIFLKKRDRVIDATDEKWVHTGNTLEGHPVNEYFVDNPHMMLGNFTTKSGPFGEETTLAPDGRDLKEALIDAVDYLPKNSMTIIADLSELNTEDNTILADPSVKNFCHVVRDGEIYQRVNSAMVKKDYAKTAAERVKSMIEMRQLTRHILNIQLEGCSDEDLQRLQGELNKEYDSFFKKFGSINSRYNHNLFSDDADFPLLSAIEELEDDGSTTKAAIFTKRTISQTIRPDHADTASEALSISLNERGYVDIGYMGSLTGKPGEEIIEDLQGIIYKNPEYDDPDNESNLFIGWETADEYLSGEVRNKLHAAEKIAESNPLYKINVEALQAVQPVPLEAHEISVRIGASWVDEMYYRKFILEKLNPPGYEHDRVKVNYSSYTGNWTVEKPYSGRNSIEATQAFGTKRMDAYELYELTLNQKSPKIYDRTTDDHGNEKSVLNHKETVAIREKQAQLKQEFKKWIFDEPERRDRLCTTYNRLFNSSRLREYDGNHLTFPGMSPDIDLRKHQQDAVARILYGGNSLLAHCVGAGKTYTMAAAAMELKRLGVSKKCCFVVPNHLVLQWSNEFQRLYPTANILAASKKDFEKHNRQRFCGRIATGEWDAVIIGHSQFEKVPMSRERLIARMEREVNEIGGAIYEAKQAKGQNVTVKELQRALKSVEYELKKLQDSPKDSLVTFEQLGVDTLFVDEAHSYKNKFIFTKMNNVAGLSKARAKKSTDMDMKCGYINELNGLERGVVFATGTPVSNSMVELYTMQTYLQRKELEHRGLHHFDNWAANFGEVVSALELAPSGQGYRMKERFSKFVNLPELMNLYRQVSDIQTADMLKLPVPELKDGKPITIAVAPTPEQRAKVAELVERAQAIYNNQVKPEQDNMLCVTNDGRNVALDARCVDPDAEDYPDSKVNTCIKNVMKIYEETAESKLTQMIFCDLSTPKGGKSFSVYDDMKAKFLAMGIPEKEVAFIHDANTNEQKEKIFSQVRSGDIRILIGSTQKMGSGTNAQNKLIAMHNLDCPYRPSDLEQRSGRIVRQGNQNPVVQIYNYVTKESFDAYLWQIVENKQKFISQVMSGKNPTRSMEDIDETVLNFAEIKAIATGNPKIKRKMELDMELSRLMILESQYRAGRYSLEDSILKKFPAKVTELKETIKGLSADIIKRGDIEGKEFSISFGKKTFDERKDAGELLLKAMKSGKYAGTEIGSLRGFTIIPQENDFYGNSTVLLRGEKTYKVELSGDAVGSIMRLENALKGLENALSEKQRSLLNVEQQIESAKEQLKHPFENEQTLQEVLSELSQINAELDINKSDEAEPVLSEGSENEDVLGLDETEENEDEYENEA